MLSAVVGLLVCALSIGGMFHWKGELLLVLKGLLPLSFLVGGLLAVIAGLSSLKPGRKSEADAGGERNGAAGEEHKAPHSPGARRLSR